VEDLLISVEVVSFLKMGVKELFVMVLFILGAFKLQLQLLEVLLLLEMELVDRVFGVVRRFKVWLKRGRERERYSLIIILMNDLYTSNKWFVE